MSVFDEAEEEQIQCVRSLVLAQDFHHVTANHLGPRRLLCFYRTCLSSPTKFRIVAFVSDSDVTRAALGKIQVFSPGKWAYT